MVIEPLVHFRELQRIYDPYAWVLEDAEELVTRLLGDQHKGTSVQTGHMPGTTATTKQRREFTAFTLAEKRNVQLC